MTKILKIILNIIIFILVIVSIIFNIQNYNKIENQEKTITELKEQIESLNIENESQNTTSNSNDETITYEDTSYSNIKSVDYSNLTKMLNSQKSFILIVTQTTCPHCTEYKPNLNNVLKENNLEAYEIDLLTLTEEDYNSFQEIFNVSGTPTTIFIENGLENQIYRYSGTKEEDTIIEKLKEANYIK